MSPVNIRTCLDVHANLDLSAALKMETKHEWLKKRAY